MALSLKASNSLEILAESFSSYLAAFPGDVFQPEFIITQTQGMNNWLRVQMAHRNGIAANLRFVKPNDILYRVYFALGGPGGHLMDSGNLSWALFSELDTPSFRRRYPRIAGYYSDGDEIKRLGLAEKVGDLFDQYQIYRPEIIQQWNELAPGDSSLDWQAWLWTHIREKIGSVVLDKAALAEFISRQLSDPESVRLLKERLPRVHLFGLSILTEFHINLFHQLSSHIGIHFYLLNPAPNWYWYQDRSPEQLARWSRLPRHHGLVVPDIGNTLLTNWGKVIQDTFSLLFRHEEFINRYDDADIEVPVPATLLKKIQYDLFMNAVGEERQPISDEDLHDGSISINACYTPAREVEVLYNYLVRLVDTGQLTSPRDVIVMVIDINTYAPYIRAVFDAAPYRFPIVIADEYLVQDQGFFSALQGVMSLDSEDFKAETILQLLEFNFIRERFQITRLDLIAQAVREANIRFGIYGEEADESITLSWQNGLKRIMYGICMGQTEEYQDDGYGFYPLDIAEGEQSLDLVRFTHFVEVLISVTESRVKSRTLAAWSMYLEESVERLLIYSNRSDDPDYIIFQEYLERLKELSETVDEEISFQVFRQSVINQMASATRPGNFIGGGITFCSLIPMRSIPFRTVAMLGLNFDEFPRKEKPVTFDLIKLNPKRGDRNVRDNDKHLFLETLLSARDRLYISYIGKNPKDKSDQPPSALVDELLSYMTDKPASLVTVHPLHSFSASYAENKEPFYTYLGNFQERSILPLGGQHEQSKPFDEITISSLVNFFKNPVKFYYNKVLEIYYQEEALLLDHAEVFELNSLQEWLLKHDLLFLEDEQLKAYRDRAVKLGRLPLKNMADLSVEQANKEIETVKVMVRHCVGGAAQSTRHLELAIGDSVLTGDLSPVYENRLLLVSFSKRERKYCLEAYLLHLLSTAAGLDLETHYISMHTQEEIVILPDRLTQQQALDRLGELLGYYKAGHSQMLAYSPEFKIHVSDLHALTIDVFQAHLAKAFSERWPVFDAYLTQEYENDFFASKEAFEAYRDLAELVYAPVYEIFNR